MSKKIIICHANDDEIHYMHVQELAFIYIFNLDTQQEHFINFHLIDSEKVSLIEFDKEDYYFVSDKKLFDKQYPGLQTYDLNTQHWLYYNKEFFHWGNYELYNNFKRFYKDYENWVCYVPLMKWKEICNLILKDVLKNAQILHLNELSEYYSTKVYPNMTFIESSGIRINTSLFNTLFAKDYDTNYLHCDYHLHTSTGRPSNTFDNVNFSALNKKDGSRQCFISRFEKGVLIEFDLDAYHLRLIGQILDYPLPNESVHLYFGRMFFKKSELTDEEYIQSKNTSFKLAYGGLTSEYAHIDFFTKMEDFKNQLWRTFNLQGAITSPLSGRHIEKKNFSNMNASKIFNYLLQTLETEYSIVFIEEIRKILNQKKSKLILYTYDSFLIDYCLEDGVQVLKDIKNALLNCRVRVGVNYQELKLFDIPSL